jgi:hypothetical protein
MERLREILAHKERENTEQDQRIKQTDYDLFKLQERASELSKIADMREFDLRRTTEAYEAAHFDLIRAREEQARLQDE